MYRDNLGVEILPTDTVYVCAWGNGARLVDTGTRSPVAGYGRSRVVIDDSDGYRRSVHPSELQVLRRDGEPGFEGNRPRCTCGAHVYSGCFCGLSPRDFLASPLTNGARRM